MSKISVHKGTSQYATILLLILGIVVAIGPYTVYPICSGTMHGNCYDTGHAEIVLGALIALFSAITLFLKDTKKRTGLTLIVLVLAVLSVLFVTSITGTCDGSMMACNKTGKPGIIAVGTVTAFVAVIGLVFEKAGKRRVR